MSRLCRWTPCLAAVLLAGPAADSRAAAGDGPADVFRAYADALAAGDSARAATYVIADAKRLTLLDGQRAAAEVEGQFRAAVNRAYPKALPATQPTTRPIDGAVHIDHDTATITPGDAGEPVKLRRVDGVWKVDLNAMYTDAAVDDMEIFRRALRDVLAAMTADVVARKFQTYAEVQAELETRVKMKLATPDESATTRPVL